MKRIVSIFSILLVPILFSDAVSAYGSNIKMEIFYLSHRPALTVVGKVEKIAAEFKNIVTSKYDFEDPASTQLLKKYKLAGHMPVAIFINGQNSFTVDGKKISLQSFPRGDAFVPTFAGEWDYADLKKILDNISGGK